MIYHLALLAVIQYGDAQFCAAVATESAAYPIRCPMSLDECLESYVWVDGVRYDTLGCAVDLSELVIEVTQ